MKNSKGFFNAEISLYKARGVLLSQSVYLPEIKSPIFSNYAKRLLFIFAKLQGYPSHIERGAKFRECVVKIVDRLHLLPETIAKLLVEKLFLLGR